jgi:hypothetical protein
MRRPVHYGWNAIGVGLLVLGLALLAVRAPAQTAPAASMSYDGLQEVKRKNLDLLYVRPDASLAGYKKVWLDPVEVAFHKSWKRDRQQVSASDRERIRRDMAEEFRRVFTEELEEKGGYEIVAAAGPDVLRVTAGIINLYISAPDTMQAGRSKTYTVSAGEMTLVAELRDAETGAILARVADRKSGPSSGRLQWATRGTNITEARRALRAWATVLRTGLDSARGVES